MISFSVKLFDQLVIVNCNPDLKEIGSFWDGIVVKKMCLYNLTLFWLGNLD